MMKWFLNLKTSAKLIFGFVVVVVVAGIVGIIGITNINQIGQADTQLFEKNTLSMQYLTAAKEDYLRIRLTVAKGLLTTGEPQDDNLKSISDLSEQFKSSLALYENCILNADDRTAYDSISASWDKYIGYVDEVFKLVQANKPEEADTLAFGDHQTAANELQSILDKLLASNITSAQASATNNQQIVRTAITLMIAVVAAGILVAVVLGVVISRIIANPMKLFSEFAKMLAVGDIQVEKITTQKDRLLARRKDEIGVLASSFDKIIESTVEQATATQRIADGDLTTEIKIRSESDTMGKALSQLVDKFNDLVLSISSASDQVTSGANLVSNSSMTLSQGASEQASSVEELTASVEEITTKTAQNTQNAQNANDLAQNAKGGAETGNAQMREMLKAMEEINAASGSINKIIKVIDDIAFQTNILALNAAVETARAGQHGKGFAVVAEEVRTLAARSAQAAKETTDLIESSIQKVGAGTKIANSTAEALGKIVNEITNAADLVEAIAIASREQTSAIEQINQGIQQVSQVVQNNAATSEESAAASEELSSQAVQLKELVGIFKLKNTIVKAPAEQAPVQVAKQKPAALPPANAKISLSPNDFGKY
jgi:methyl-accepting chemotaxis protein